jgi:ATP adenylyltransferase
MVAPYAHVGDFAQLDGPTLADMMQLVQRIVRALQETYQAHGFNIGLNLGEAAGAGITDHLHVHVVPRWRGDTNFMTVNAGVRVVPEDLAQTCLKLRTALGEHGA